MSVAIDVGSKKIPQISKKIEAERYHFDGGCTFTKFNINSFFFSVTPSIATDMIDGAIESKLTISLTDNKQTLQNDFMKMRKIILKIF